MQGSEKRGLTCYDAVHQVAAVTTDVSALATCRPPRTAAQCALSQ